ncbi:hypothetical protein J6590_024033 [Homalodisca vitripennis]|nr:hypothetical protein J6590_024033 [Homalodisca vitripennis]
MCKAYRFRATTSPDLSLAVAAHASKVATIYDKSASRRSCSDNADTSCKLWTCVRTLAAEWLLNRWAISTPAIIDNNIHQQIISADKQTATGVDTMPCYLYSSGAAWRSYTAFVTLENHQREDLFRHAASPATAHAHLLTQIHFHS